MKRMESHRIEATLEQDGTLTLEHLPFHAGETVQITIVGKDESHTSVERRKLRGTPVTIVDPFVPIAEHEWESSQ
jgi:hypothetical protein